MTMPKSLAWLLTLLYSNRVNVNVLVHTFPNMQIMVFYKYFGCHTAFRYGQLSTFRNWIWNMFCTILLDTTSMKRQSSPIFPGL